MTRQVLQNKPLVEAIFEIHWDVQSREGEGKADPFYTILIGRVYERVQDKYPFHEQLPSANIPVEMMEMMGRVVQHRFRAAEDSWPLVQLGPGVATLNDTVGYNWDNNFRFNISGLSTTLFDAHPQTKDLRIQKLILRYINAVDFDYESENVFHFLRDMMRINIDINEDFFVNTGISSMPDLLDLRFAFPSVAPEGKLQVRFAKGDRDEKSALIWETVFTTDRPAISQSAEGVIQWADQAHDLIRNWFFKTIAGELHKRFE